MGNSKSNLSFRFVGLAATMARLKPLLTVSGLNLTRKRSGRMVTITIPFAPGKDKAFLPLITQGRIFGIEVAVIRDGFSAVHIVDELDATYFMQERNHDRILRLAEIMWGARHDGKRAETGPVHVLPSAPYETVAHPMSIPIPEHLLQGAVARARVIG